MIQAHAIDSTFARAVIPALVELREKRVDIESEISKMITGFEIVADEYESVWTKAAREMYNQEPTEENWRYYLELRERADEVVDNALELFAKYFRQLWY